MEINRYWEIRLSDCKKSLEKNNFDAFIAETPSDAKKIVIDKIGILHFSVYTFS